MIPAGTTFTWPDGRSVVVLASCPPSVAWTPTPTADPAVGLRAIGASHDADHDGYLVVAVSGIRFGRAYREGEAPVALEVWPYKVPDTATATLPNV